MAKHAIAARNTSAVLQGHTFPCQRQNAMQETCTDRSHHCRWPPAEKGVDRLGAVVHPHGVHGHGVQLSHLLGTQLPSQRTRVLLCLLQRSRARNGHCPLANAPIQCHLRHGLLMPIRQDLHLLQTRHRLRFAELLRAGFAGQTTAGQGRPSQDRHVQFLANLQKAIALGQTPQQGELDLIEDQRHAAILQQLMHLTQGWFVVVGDPHVLH
mmetsp:Transcript_67655/g.148412  ORF Transcript_67655/g.148412 Transcript_67655/m.148412 type:complete len:211 (-) Transcript_67655:463-1095(-)